MNSSRLFKHQNILLILLLLINAIFLSCTNFEFNGDIKEVLEQQTTSTVYFMKDPESAPAFSQIEAA